MDLKAEVLDLMRESGASLTVSDVARLLSQRIEGKVGLALKELHADGSMERQPGGRLPWRYQATPPAPIRRT